MIGSIRCSKAPRSLPGPPPKNEPSPPPPQAPRGSDKVVVHPLALRYQYGGDVRQTVEPVLTEIEGRLSWRPQKHLSLEDRIAKLGQSLLALKEIEYLGQPQTGTVGERLQRLIDALLVPLEKEWLKGLSETHVIVRVKKLRSAVLADMIGELPEAEQPAAGRNWRDMYLARAALLLSAGLPGIESHAGAPPGNGRAF